MYLTLFLLGANIALSKGAKGMDSKDKIINSLSDALAGTVAAMNHYAPKCETLQAKVDELRYYLDQKDKK